MDAPEFYRLVRASDGVSFGRVWRTVAKAEAFIATRPRLAASYHNGTHKLVPVEMLG